MHDVDRTLREFETGTEFESMEAESGEQEQFLGSVLGGMLGGEMETGETFEAEVGEQEAEAFLGETGEFQSNEAFLGEAEHEGVFDEVNEMELAAELLEVSNEAELEQFLGSLIKKAGKAIGGIARSPIGRALGGALKAVAKKALPIAGTALGNLVVPGLGGMIGGKLASAAGNMFGLELEGLSPQDREFEVARRFVRFAGATTQRALRTPPSIPPGRAVRSALVGAARRHAPGLLQPRSAYRRRRSGAPIFRPGGLNGRSSYTVPSVETPSYTTGQPYGDGSWGYSYTTPGFTRSGRWYRRGRKIVLVGL